MWLVPRDFPTNNMQLMNVPTLHHLSITKNIASQNEIILLTDDGGACFRKVFPLIKSM
jgi:hypothetical protein